VVVLRLLMVVLLRLLLMLVVLMLVLRLQGLLGKMLFLGIVRRMPRGIRLVVGVMRSSHTVQHGMTAKIVRSKLNNCRH